MSRLSAYASKIHAPLFVGFMLLLLFAMGTSVGATPGGVSTNLQLWLKADSGVYEDVGLSDAAEDGDQPLSWADSGPNSYDADESNGDAVWNTSAINHNPSISFDGTDDYIGLDNTNADALLGGVTDFTYFIVFDSATPSPVQERSFWDESTNALNSDFSLIQDNNPSTFTDTFFYSYGSRDTSYIAQSSTIPSVPGLTSSSWSTGGTLTGNVNGRAYPVGNFLDLNGAIDTADIDYLHFGASYQNTGTSSTFFDYQGDIAEFVFYDSVLNDTQRKLVESYLALKYGVTLIEAVTGQSLIDQTLTGGGVGNAIPSNIGQSFTAPESTEISSITFKGQIPTSGGTADLYICNGEVLADTCFGAPDYTEAGIAIGTVFQDYIIPLTTAYPISIGNQYTFVLRGTSGTTNLTTMFQSGDPYSGGQYTKGGIFDATRDLRFEIIGPQPFATDYIASDGITKMWTAADNTGYQNDVAGIGVDTTSGLSQTTSRSVHTDSIVIGSGATDLEDNEFVTWSNDDGDVTTPETVDIPGTVTARLAREWKADITGGDGPGNLTIAFDLDDQTAFNIGAPSNYSLLIDNDGTFADAVVSSAVASFNGNEITFTGVTELDDGEYFTMAGPTSGISGTVYTDKGTTDIGAGKTVRLLVNGVDSGLTDDTDALGAYFIDGAVVTALAGGEILTLYLDDETENGVAIATATGPSMGVDVYQDTLIVRDDNTDSVDNATDLALADNADPGSSADDISGIYTLGGSNNLIVTNNLYIEATGDYTPGANVDAAGDIDINGTFDIAANAINVGGDFYNVGTFTTLAGSSITMDGTTAQTIRHGAAINSDLIIANTTATVSPVNTSLNVDDLTINDNATLALGGLGLTVNGVFDNGNTANGASARLELEGTEPVSLTNDTDSGSIVFIGDGNGSTSFRDMNAVATTFYNLEINDVVGLGDQFSLTAPTTVFGSVLIPDGFIATLGISVDIEGDLDIDSAGVFNSNSSTVNLAGDFSNDGFYSNTSGTTILDGCDQSLSRTSSTTFNNLTKVESTNDSTDCTLTLSAGDDFFVAGTLTLDGLDTDDRLNLVSSTPTTEADIFFNNAASALSAGDYLDISDNYLKNTGPGAVSFPVNPADSISSLSNTSNWFSADIEFSDAAGASTDESAANNWPTVFVNGALAAPITVDVDITGGTASAADYTSADPISLTIPAGTYTGTTADDIIVALPTMLDDTLFEGDETITLSLTNLVGDNVQIGDADGSSIVESMHTYTVTDDETATSSITASDSSATENPETNGAFTIALDKTNNTGSSITVSYAVNGSSTAVSGSDYAALSGSVTIADGANSATISVDTSGLDDALTDGDRTVVVDLSSTGLPAVTIGSPAQATVTIYDDESDTDGDGVPDATEIIDGTDPTASADYKDTDGDLVPDYTEVNVDGTDETDGTAYKDTDDDLVPDYIEINIDGTNHTNSTLLKDTDGGGVPDYVEVTLQPNKGRSATDPTSAADDDNDGDGVSDVDENIAPGGDGNGDGTPDRMQSGVASRANPATGAHTTLDLSGTCVVVNGFQVVAESSLSALDPDADYPVGLNDFQIQCPSAGDSTTVTFYYDQVYDTSSWSFKKFDDNGNVYSDITSIVAFGTADVNGTTVTTATYVVTDGGPTDTDGTANRFIDDPAGPAVAVAGLSETGQPIVVTISVGAVVVLLVIIINRKNVMSR